jgi:hypothetical protein
MIFRKRNINNEYFLKYVDGKQTFFKVKYLNGVVKEINLVNGKPNGKVKQIDANGTIMEGTIVNDQWHGHANLTYPDGSTSEVNCVNGKIGSVISNDSVNVSMSLSDIC